MNSISKEERIEQDWGILVTKLSSIFSDGDALQVDTILYLIGIQELGKGASEFTKDDKINIMHIAVCKILEPYGYYQYSHQDPDGWPHFEVLKKLPHLNATAQNTLMQEAILDYFEKRNF